MIILDKLLKFMKAKGSRVSIFSQMSRVLGILEDYCLFRGFSSFLCACRSFDVAFCLQSIAASMAHDEHIERADRKCRNPQADLQAMDGAHRIRQMKQVYVFVTRALRSFVLTSLSFSKVDGSTPKASIITLASDPGGVDFMYHGNQEISCELDMARRRGDYQLFPRVSTNHVCLGDVLRSSSPTCLSMMTSRPSFSVPRAHRRAQH